MFLTNPSDPLNVFLRDLVTFAFALLAYLKVRRGGTPPPA